jgi:hypothetical protein
LNILQTPTLCKSLNASILRPKYGNYILNSLGLGGYQLPSFMFIKLSTRRSNDGSPVLFERLALKVVAWLAALAALLAALAILSIWFLVPNNLALTQAANIREKLWWCWTFALGFIISTLLAKWAFAKGRKLG